MMASYCIPQSSCSTHRSSWVNGDHPTSLYATVNTTVCMHWSSTCCERSYPVSITQCDGYYVYKLQKPTSCYERYCGVLGECSKKKTFSTVFLLMTCKKIASSIFSHLFFSFVTQMRMMRVLEPQDQTSVLVIRVIQEILVPVG